MKIYAVGGSVRDELLGRPVADRDWVVVGATPAEMVARGFRAVGSDFPVFLHPETHEEYALARTERKTAPGYKGFAFHASPEVTLEEDLRRRDLTINAIAREADGTLVDPHGGAEDLRRGILRHVSESFVEDPVRILRVARFAARFGFAVAPETQALMRAHGGVGRGRPPRSGARLAGGGPRAAGAPAGANDRASFATAAPWRGSCRKWTRWPAATWAPCSRRAWRPRRPSRFPCASPASPSASRRRRWRRCASGSTPRANAASSPASPPASAPRSRAPAPSGRKRCWPCSSGRTPSAVPSASSGSWRPASATSRARGLARPLPRERILAARTAALAVDAAAIARATSAVRARRHPRGAGRAHRGRPFRRLRRRRGPQ